jgi:hypothetical protein
MINKSSKKRKRKMKNTMTVNYGTIPQYNRVQNYGVNQLIDRKNELVDTYGCDLHNELYNIDYFIVGTRKAEDFLGHAFRAIDTVKKYEIDNFGEMNTEIDPEKIANMLAYIIGEDILLQSDTLQEKLNDRLTEEDINEIISELNEKDGLSFISE